MPQSQPVNPPPSQKPVDPLQEDDILEDVLGEGVFEDSTVNPGDDGASFVATALKKDEELDRQLQREMIETVQAPAYTALKVTRQRLPTFAKKQVSFSCDRGL